jgi:CarboxypepD_reg-like domain
MKRLHFLFILLLYFLFTNTGIHSQQIITGTITDASLQQPLPFASIAIPGTSQGTLADADGNFTLPLPSGGDSIKISAIGYHTQTFYVPPTPENTIRKYELQAVIYDLQEVKIKPKNKGYLTLGTSKYSQDICTAFIGKNGHWKGEQAAIKANNKEGRTVFLESFHFYIIKNDYTDSLQFRLMLYEIDSNGYPGKTFLKRPILFKTSISQGEVSVGLKDYNISATGDFFISLECLEEQMESARFCFAGSIKVPSYFKTNAFSRWGKVKGGGGDFNLKVSYAK